ncbi:hypothetical protein [Bacillus xiapuensis]|uniref:pyroglutamyl-peptidase I family protein n=1 Tax=Bacillus xiapuensis TaxID=2014075 RepID=UPI003AF31A47
MKATRGCNFCFRTGRGRADITVKRIAMNVNDARIPEHNLYVFSRHRWFCVLFLIQYLGFDIQRIS